MTETIEQNRFGHITATSLTTGEQQSLLDLALALLTEQHRPGEPLGSPCATKAYLRLQLGHRRNELFGCVFLDNRHRVLSNDPLFTGTIDGASVYPRVVVQRALETNAAAVIFYHNHPSGVAEPSVSDQALTTRLRNALALVDIRVLDHFVVTAGECVSFAEQGLL